MVVYIGGTWILMINQRAKREEGLVNLDARSGSRLQEIHVQTVPSAKDLLIDYLNSPGHQHSSIITLIIITYLTEETSLAACGRRYWTDPSSPLRSVAGELLCAFTCQRWICTPPSSHHSLPLHHPLSPPPRLSACRIPATP